MYASASAGKPVDNVDITGAHTFIRGYNTIRMIHSYTSRSHCATAVNRFNIYIVVVLTSISSKKNGVKIFARCFRHSHAPRNVFHCVRKKQKFIYVNSLKSATIGLEWGSQINIYEGPIGNQEIFGGLSKFKR